MTSRENDPSQHPQSSLQHPQWELVTDTEAEISLDTLRDAFAGVFDTSSSEPSTTIPDNATDGSDIPAILPNVSSIVTSDIRPESESPTVIPSETSIPSPPTASMSSASGPQSTTDEPSQALQDEAAQPEDSRCRLSPQSILEAMLFTGGPGGGPLTAVRASEPMRGVKPEDIPELIHQLNEKYLRTGRAFEIVPCGQGYQMKLRPQYASIRNLFSGKVREAKLSTAAVQVLSIVAWKQPITAEQVTEVRGGAPSQTLLSQLVRRRLLCVERPDGDRVAVYRTTERFLQLFHLQSLADLPQSDDF